MVELYPLTNDQVFDCPDTHGQHVPYCYEQQWLNMFRKVFPYQLKGYRIFEKGQDIGFFLYVIMRSSFWGNRIISLPFADEGGVMAHDLGVWTPSLQQQVYDVLCQRIDEEASVCKAGYAEIRGDGFLFTGIRDGLSFVKRKAYVKFLLNTKAPYQDIRRGFHSNIIKNLKKADRCVAVRECQSTQELAELYRIYLVEMRRLGGLPLPSTYFETLWRQKTSRIFLAIIDNRIVGFLLLLIAGKRILADINAALPSVRSFFPKVRLFDSAIRWTCEKGFESFDFMRTRPNTGLYLHKKKWGGEEIPIFYYTRLYDKNVNYVLDADQKRFYFARSLVRLMPLWLLRNFGTPVRLALGK